MGSPRVARTIGRAVRAKKCTFMDTPVCGGVVAAENKELTVIIANRRETEFAFAQELFKTMGNHFCSVPGVGNGLVGKICHQVTLAINMIAVCEALNLGVQLGADKEELTRILNVSSGSTFLTENYHPVPGMGEIFGGRSVPSNHHYDGGFACKLMHKDLCLAQDAASSVSAYCPLAMSATQIYRQLCQKGYADKDYSVPYHLFHTEAEQSYDPCRAQEIPAYDPDTEEDEYEEIDLPGLFHK